jgi:hypothetical protein
MRPPAAPGAAAPQLCAGDDDDEAAPPCVRFEGAVVDGPLPPAPPDCTRVLCQFLSPDAAAVHARGAARWRDDVSRARRSGLTSGRGGFDECGPAWAHALTPLDDVDTDAEEEDVLASLRSRLQLAKVRAAAAPVLRCTPPSLADGHFFRAAPAPAKRMPRKPLSSALPEEVPVHPDVEAFVISPQDDRAALHGQARDQRNSFSKRGFSFRIARAHR